MTIPDFGPLASQTKEAPSAGTSKIRFDALDTLRGLSALMVVLYHANFSSILYNLPVIRQSYLFVDFFFVLSGFIIYYNYGRLPDSASFRQFIGMRFFRLYPLHFALLMVFVSGNALHMLIRGANNGAPAASGDTGFDLALNLVLMNGMDIRPPGFNAPSWSISTEFWTYVLFGSLVLGFRNVRKYLLAIIFMSVCVCALLAVYFHYGTLKGFVLFQFPRCVFGFFLGAAMGTVVNPRKITLASGSSPVGTALQATAIVVAVFALTVVGFSGFEVFLPVLFASVVGTFAIWPHSWLTRALSNRPLLWLGKHSYSIYMVHWFVLTQIAATLRTVFHVPVIDGRFSLAPAIGLAVTIFSIALILTAASQTYRYIEDPGRRFGRKILKRSRNPSSFSSTAPSPEAPTNE